MALEGEQSHWAHPALLDIARALPSCKRAVICTRMTESRHRNYPWCETCIAWKGLRELDVLLGAQKPRMGIP